jgi:uroporphyrinogen-III synthase
VKLLIIRPEPGASATAGRVSEAGFEPVTLPFFEIRARAWHQPDSAQYDALLFTSANAVRHAGTGIVRYRHLPVHTVGERTATALAELGIEAASTGSAGVEQAIEAAQVAGHRRLLWLAGEDHQAPMVPDSIKLDTAICYAASAKRLPEDAKGVIAGCSLILLHSARAARQFGNMVYSFGLDRSDFLLAAFSPAIAGAAGTGWRDVAIARQPTDSGLLSAVTDLVKLHDIAEMRKDTE